MKTLTGRRRKALWITLIVIAVLVAIRLALPYVVLHYANKSLATMKGYRGHIRDIDIALIRGAYKIDSVYLNKVDSVTQKETPFFAASLIDLSIEWKSLFKGSVVGEVVCEDPLIRFTKDKAEPKQVAKDSTQLKKVGDDFMPLEVNKFEIRNGRIQYVDEYSHPKVDVTLSKAHVVGLNLRNSYDSSALLPATIQADAEVYDGTFSLNMKLNPLAEEPTFDVNAELKNTNLVKLNDFFKAYANVDVNRGNFGLYTEVAAKDGKFTGYVKPLMKNLKVLGPEDRKDNVLRKLWEGFVGGVGEVFENHKHDRLATKIPFSGNIKSPKANVWFAIGEVLQNAFIQALQPSLDQEINIAAVDKAPTEKKNLLQKVFGKKDKADDKNKDTAKDKERDKDKKKKG
jgi:hypothetical protein